MAVDDIIPVSSQSSMVDIKDERTPMDLSGKSTIHSGHFMVSRVHDANQDEEEGEEGITPPFTDDAKGFDFLTAAKETSKVYNFGNGSQSIIDASLTKLFECMTLAYSGKITSPRWKQFRGLHLSQKQRIRLNNLIWREWHMQYIYQKYPIVCQFATPFEDIHSKPEAVVLEGKYWKRRLDTVTAEYKKWRRYFKDRISQSHTVNLKKMCNLEESELLERVKEVTFIPHSTCDTLSSTDLNLLQSDADMDFTNDLFNSLNTPFAFPNPRELSQLSCADLIQPGLVQLQPNLEEFMDVMDPLQELLNAKMPTSSFFSEPSNSVLDVPASPFQSYGFSDMSLVDFLTSNVNLLPNESGLVSTLKQIQQNQRMLQQQQQQQQQQQLQQQQQQQQQQLQQQRLQQQQQQLQQQQQAQPSITFQLASDSSGQYSLDSPTTILLGQALSGATSGSTSSTNNRGLAHTFTVVPNSSSNNLYPNFLNQPNTLQAVSSPLTITQLKQEPEHTIISGSMGGPVTSLSSDLGIQASLSQPFHNQLQQQSPLQSSHQQLQHTPPQQQQQQHRQIYSHTQPQNSLLAQTLSGQLPAPQQPRQIIIQSSHSHPAVSVAPQTQLVNMAGQTVRTVKSSGGGKTSTILANKQPGGLGNASGVLTGLARQAESHNNKKKDGPFAVPVAPRKTPRHIAPAPSSSSSHQQTAQNQSPSSQASYLAELLKSGNYPRAQVNVKKEPPVIKTTTNYQSIRPNPGPQLNSPTPTTSMAPIAPAPPVSTIKNTLGGQQSLPSIIAGASLTALDSSMSLTTQGLTGVVLSPIGAGIDLSSPVFSPDSKMVKSPLSMVSSPVSPAASPGPSTLLPKSPAGLVASPLEMKRSPSPTMDTDFGDSSDSFNSGMPSSPSSSMIGDASDAGFRGDNRRAAHLSAEQKRRCNLKTGFDMLQQLVPSLSQNPKVSKATMLQKTAEFIKKLKTERTQMQKEAEILKQEIESLNQAIGVVQSQLPETGVPVTRQRKDQMKEMFDEYVRSRTNENWKFWVFSVIMNSLYDSYCNTVSTASMEEMYRTALTWLDQSCSLVLLRPNVLTALTRLSTKTSILTEPVKVKEEALEAVAKLPHKGSSGLGKK